MKEWEVHEKMGGGLFRSFSYRNSFPQVSYCQKVCSVSSLAFSTLEKSNAANDNTESWSTAQNACLILSEFYRVMTTAIWKEASWHRIKQCTNSFKYGARH